MADSIRLLPDAEILVCETCNGLWTRQVQTGKKPRWCPRCLTLECEHCGDDFKIDRLRQDRPQRWCSRQCRDQARTERSRPETTCNNCGDVFRPKRSSRAGDYCSRGCAYEDFDRWHSAGGRQPEVADFCPSCGREFLIARGYSRRYCSKLCSERGPVRVCVQCSSIYWRKTGYGRYCTYRCYLDRQKAKRWARRGKRTGTCCECGAEFSEDYGPGFGQRKYCSETCVRRARRRRNRARKRNRDSEPYDAMDIYQRDNWVCGICGEQVMSSKSYPHPKSPTIDHIVPLSAGGDDTRRNVQCAHARCNALKSDGSAGSQLLLVG